MAQKFIVTRPLQLDETLVIEEITNSEATIATASNTFRSGISHYFLELGLDKKSVDTKEMVVKPLELIKDARLAEIFNSNNLDEVCFTQAQIIRFCEKYPRQLRQNGCANLFLFKENKKYFVASVNVYFDGLYVHVFRLGSVLGLVWGDSRLHRVFLRY